MAAQNIYVDNVIHQNESSVFPYPFDILLNPHMTISEKRERIPHIVTALEEFNGILSTERPGFWTGTLQNGAEPSMSSHQEQSLPSIPETSSSQPATAMPLSSSPVDVLPNPPMSASTFASWYMASSRQDWLESSSQNNAHNNDNNDDLDSAWNGIQLTWEELEDSTDPLQLLRSQLEPTEWQNVEMRISDIVNEEQPSPTQPSPTQPSSTRRSWQPLPSAPTQTSPIQPSSSRGDWQPRPPPSSDGTPWQGRRLPSWVIELGDEDYTSDDDDADYISGFADDDDDDDILFANVIDLPDYEPPTPQLGSHYTIEQLPTSQITSQQTDDGLTCTVCCSEYNLDETVCQTACKHYFHADCLEPWIQGRLTCPVCRQNVFVLQDSEDN